MEKNKAVNKKNGLTIDEKLSLIQQEFKAKKSRFNSFGKYNFRSAEDILEALKPINGKYGVYFKITEDYIQSELVPIIKSTATVFDITDINCCISATAIVGIDLNQKGMQVPQQFGSASSYGKKYALGNLLLIDDTADADATNDHGILKQKISTTINNTIAETNQKKSVTSKKVAGNGSVKIEKFVIDENSIKKIKNSTDAKKALTSNKVIFSNENIKNELMETFNLK
tara:strand:+ start:54 stop:737 length:684 start_codon:yes stop_codon:yes gene_type:complete